MLFQCVLSKPAHVPLNLSHLTLSLSVGTIFLFFLSPADVFHVGCQTQKKTSSDGLSHRGSDSTDEVADGELCSSLVCAGNPHLQAFTAPVATDEWGLAAEKKRHLRPSQAGVGGGRSRATSRAVWLLAESCSLRPDLSLIEHRLDEALAVSEGYDSSLFYNQMSTHDPRIYSISQSALKDQQPSKSAKGSTEAGQPITQLAHLEVTVTSQVLSCHNLPDVCVWVSVWWLMMVL